ncbi:hypothetical protein HBB16_04630 [Pseudonocardia sp. MCCB 268]|nr:hypothetical protein [Pseudonocardia cytotoxica]
MTAIGGVAGAFAAMGVVFVVAGLGRSSVPCCGTACPSVDAGADVVAVRQDRRVTPGTVLARSP